MKHWIDRFFLIDRRAIPESMPWRHPDSSVSELPPFGGFQQAHIDALTSTVVDIQAVHPALLFEAGLTRVWKYPEHRPVFKDGEGNGNSSLFLRFWFLRFLYVAIFYTHQSLPLFFLQL